MIILGLKVFFITWLVLVFCIFVAFAFEVLKYFLATQPAIKGKEAGREPHPYCWTPCFNQKAFRIQGRHMDCFKDIFLPGAKSSGDLSSPKRPWEETAWKKKDYEPFIPRGWQLYHYDVREPKLQWVCRREKKVLAVPSSASASSITNGVNSGDTLTLYKFVHTPTTADLQRTDPVLRGFNHSSSKIEKDFAPIEEGGTVEPVKKFKNSSFKDECLFLTILPAEVRNLIYSYVLTTSAPISNAGELVEQMAVGLIMTDETNPSTTLGIDSTLMRTCHKIYAETVPLLYGENIFYFKNLEHLKTFRNEGLVQIQGQSSPICWILS